MSLGHPTDGIGSSQGLNRKIASSRRLAITYVASPREIPRPSTIILIRQCLDVSQGLGQLADDGSWDSASGVAFLEEHQVFEVLGLLEAGPGAVAEGVVAVSVGVHVV